jgi:hypothetical protein
MLCLEFSVNERGVILLPIPPPVLPLSPPLNVAVHLSYQAISTQCGQICVLLQESLLDGRVDHRPNCPEFVT